jgi:AcrR family transcriptional regulator
LAVLSINEIEGGSVPRQYTLGKRGEAQAETRRRIVETTLRLYREVGIAGATVPVIARAADVAPATVRNHFPGPTDLADAAADAILEALRMPDATIFAGVAGPTARLERLLVEVAAFFERATGWWEVREADRARGDAWATPEARYDERIRALIAAAVEPLGDDPVVVAVIAAVLVHVYFAARSSGLSSDAAVDVERRLLVPWLDARMAAHRG